MNQTIDLSLKEVVSTYNYSFLHGAKRYLKERMTKIENKYFQGKRLYHRKGPSSPYIFRYEIQGLLLLLLKLETDNPLSDNRTSKTGVTNETIDKILESYQYLENSDLLSDHEKIILDNLPNAKQEFEFYTTIKEFQKALTRYIFLTAKNYSKFPSDQIKSVTNYINQMASSISYLSTEIGRANVKAMIPGSSEMPVIALNRHDNTASLFDSLSLDLKKAVVKAINIISEAMYFFDENGICYRNTSIHPDDKCFSMNNEYIALCNRHMKNFKKDVRKQVELSEYDLQDGDSIAIIRMELTDFLNQFWEKQYQRVVDLSSTSTTVQPPPKKIDDPHFNMYSNNPSLNISEFKRYLALYLLRYCQIKSSFMGICYQPENLSTEKREEIFDEYKRMRKTFYDYSINGRTFSGTDLEKIEDAIFARCKELKYIPCETEVWITASIHVDNFLHNTAGLYKMRCIEFDYIDQHVIHDEGYIEIRDNMKAISSIALELVKNTLAMILKMEMNGNNITEDFIIYLAKIIEEEKEKMKSTSNQTN